MTIRQPIAKPSGTPTHLESDNLIIVAIRSRIQMSDWLNIEKGKATLCAQRVRHFASRVRHNHE